MPTSSAPFANPQLPGAPEGEAGNALGGGPCSLADVFPMTSALAPYAIGNYFPPCITFPCQNTPCIAI